MSAPVPLSDPSGALRAWACGACGHVFGGMQPRRESAARCCTCAHCGADTPNARKCTVDCRPPKHNTVSQEELNRAIDSMARGYALIQSSLRRYR